MESSDYQRGYDAAYAQICTALNSDDHPSNGGDRHACGIKRTVLEDAMTTLATNLSQNEFCSLAAIL